MIKFEKTYVFGWEAAIRGMRNPMNSWDMSDSYYGMVEDPSPINPDDWAYIILGENDLKLMKSLSKAGSDHGKFLRFINVTVDITAPLYWWKEFDTYKVGTVANSCSTMHKIHDKPFTSDDFSFDEELFDLDIDLPGKDEFLHTHGFMLVDYVTFHCENLRQMYLKTKDKRYWRLLIQFLPTSYNQKRTVQLNYQVLKSMYFARRHHKLDEWREFCTWCESLPYFKEICIQE